VSDKLIDRVLKVLDSARTFDSNVFEAPIAILWPDEERQWEGAISELQQHRPIMRYGTFDLEVRQGHSYWLRCVIAGTLELEGAPAGIPIVYLPGISRSALSALDVASADLAPLGALQYRCQSFNHPNGKDWTIRGLLSNKEIGFGLEVAGDEATTEALAASLSLLIDRPMAQLQSKYIDAAFLNGMLSPDLAGLLLNWLDDPIGTRNSLEDASWAAFASLCRQDFGFNPAAQGEIAGAGLLGQATGPWAQVWQRFCENPADYPGIPERLNQAQPAELIPSKPGAWPGLAASAEDHLRSGLLALSGSAPQQAREEILKLEEVHRVRRGYVWATLGRTPLALALEHLAETAEATSTGPAGSSVEAIKAWYVEEGWRADRSVLAALSEVTSKQDLQAIEAGVNSVYRPWMEQSAKALQEAIGPAANAGAYAATSAPKPIAGDVVVFVDGLRFDVANILMERLDGAGLDTTLDAGLAALPTVTQTAKPALVPIDQAQLTAGLELDARRAPEGPSAQVQVLRALLGIAGIQVLGSNDDGDPAGTAWTETGEIDHRAHDLGARIAYEIDDQVGRIATRIEELLEAGWARVTIVTDHGWLLLPGGLPKNGDLPVAVAEIVKGRCARIKPGVTGLKVPTVPWHWDPDVRIAIAPGISCFKANQEYEHGGVSPQECVVPRISVGRGAGATGGAIITKVKWRGLTLVVEFEGLPVGATVDLRSTAGDASSSIAEMGRVTGGQGKVILLVGNDDLEGERAQLVVTGSDGALLVHRETIVGQNR
jgi:hypothetical protein